jgi:hypothetical protein
MEKGTTTIKDLPFSVTFTWKEESFKITLIDGQDLFKIANLICNILEQNSINHKIEKTTKDEAIHN